MPQEKPIEVHNLAHDLTHDLTHNLSEVELKIIRFCANFEKSIIDIENHLGISGRSGTLKRALEQLSKNGLLALTIPNKPKSKNKKRITTAKGMALLNQRTGSVHCKKI